jgi:hypothetical protein
MQTDPKDIELIERFLDNDLSEAERSAFLNRIDSDPSFAKLIKLRNVLPSLLKDAENYQKIREEVKSTLDLQGGKRLFFHNPAQMALAAVILLMIATVVIFFVANEHGIVLFNKTDNLVNHNDSLKIKKTEAPAYKATKDFYRLPFDGIVFNESDQIIFKWKSRYDTVLQFVIVHKNPPVVVYQKEIKPGQDSILLSPGIIKPGSYQWYVGDKNSKRLFVIKPAIR